MPHADAKDLATVLDGGVAMMEHVDWTLEHNQTIWPVGPMHDLLATQEEDPLLVRLHGRETLRALLQGDPLQTPRAQAEVLALLHDYPSRLRYWSHLLEQDPNDLEAALEVARGENEIGQPKRGLELLAHVTNPNPRWHGLLGASWMEYMRCSMLLQVGKTEEARHACALAVQLGDPWGHVELAMIEADLKHGEAALAHARAAWANPGPSFPAVVLASGLALRACGEGRQGAGGLGQGAALRILQPGAVQEGAAHP